MLSLIVYAVGTMSMWWGLSLVFPDNQAYWFIGLGVAAMVLSRKSID
jgi:hypothetical protein